MDKALIVSFGEKSTQTLSSLLSKCGFSSDFADSCREALKKLRDFSIGLIIIDASADIEKGVSTAESLQKESDACILFIAPEKKAAEISSAFSKLNIFTISSPFEKWQFLQSVNFIQSAHGRFNNLKKEKDGLAKKVEDMKIIDRAKCCLIHYLRIPEATAHRHIEKQAMDMRCTKREVAEEILKKYES